MYQGIASLVFFLSKPSIVTIISLFLLKSLPITSKLLSNYCQILVRFCRQLGYLMDEVIMNGQKM